MSVLINASILAIVGIAVCIVLAIFYDEEK